MSNRSAKLLARLFSSLFFAIPLFSACSKMSPEECTKLRDKSFELINSASICAKDTDCKPSEWPGCAKPVNADSFDKIHGMMEGFKKGKCEEKPTDCKPPPVVFCQEGLCAFRYKPFQAPGDGMKVE
ncbi:MAG TPA: hypothetical protein VJT73_09505 [Polyangiaceae bacterium]|nr:hypothetical protein [Polyangiaceae bacterium]